MTILAQNRSLVDRLRALVGAWRLRAEPFADHHCEAVAAVYNRLASEVEAELRAWDSEALPIQDAAAESGYSAEHLRRLARAGKLLSERGERAPRHTAGVVSAYNPDEDARDIAQRLGASHA